MKRNIQAYVLLIPAAVVVVAAVFLIVKLATPSTTVITGMVEATEVDVAAKIPGRVDSVLVREGDRVNKGQVLATLQSREIDAKVERARGLMEAAQAKLDMARNGARPEEKEAVEKLYEQARHQYELAEKTFNRVQAVFADSVVSPQERDEVEFKYKAAREQMDAAKAKYDMVMKGARDEEIRAAEALVHQAENGYNEARAYQDETRLVSPLDGEVRKRIVDPGEIVAAGYPVLTVLDTRDVWVVVNLREDRMTGIAMDKVVSGAVPALDGKRFDFRVSYIAAMADFATWKATNQKGDFDLKSFEIRFRPQSPIEGFRPGMTVRLSW